LIIKSLFVLSFTIAIITYNPDLDLTLHTNIYTLSVFSLISFHLNSDSYLSVALFALNLQSSLVSNT